MADLPPLSDCGFLQVPSSDNTPLWMTCESCKASDHFWLAREDTAELRAGIRCRCGASYTHAVRPDGSTAAWSELTWVPFKEGPVQLASLEWDPVRLGLIAVVVLALVGGIGWWLFG
jgi:hypothetical protein